MRYLVRYLANGLNFFERGSESDFILFLNDFPGYDEKTRNHLMSPVLIEDTCPKSTNKIEKLYNTSSFGMWRMIACSYLKIP